MNDLILSADFGTSSLKMAVFDISLNSLRNVTVSYDYQIENGDFITIEADVLYNAFIEAARALSDYMNRVQAIAFDAFSPSMTFMDRDGHAVYPVITHLDRRAKRESAFLQSAMGNENFLKITGMLPFAGGASVTSAMWVRKNLPEVWSKTYKLGHLNTYIYKRLTGVFATDHVNASMTGMYRTVSDDGWSPEVTNIAGIPADKLPEINAAGTSVGMLLDEAARQTGMKAGIPVIFGSNDAATAQIGAGNTRAGQALNIAGSSEMISILTDKPVVNGKYSLRRAISPGIWQIYATTAGGFALEWFRESLLADMDKTEFYEEYLPRAVLSGEAIRERFHPYLAGDRQSLRKKRASFSGLTLDTTPHKLLTALVHGINRPLADTIRLSEELLALSDTIKVTGGLARVKGYMELKKRCFGAFRFEIADDCPLRGNALMAAGYYGGTKQMLLNASEPPE